MGDKGFLLLLSEHLYVFLLLGRDVGLHEAVEYVSFLTLVNGSLLSELGSRVEVDPSIGAI